MSVVVPPHPRGRSRQLSRIALARQASEERRRAAEASTHQLTLTPPLSSSTPPPNDSESSPSSLPSESSSDMSPSRAIEDQLHVAYAHDDIHRAKVLLLKLKGIDVTSDDDPRIAAVQDEDFDYYFVPNGGLVIDDALTKQNLAEQRRMETEKRAERKKLEKMRACERLLTNQSRKPRDDGTSTRSSRMQEVSASLDERMKNAKEEEEKRRLERWRKSTYYAGRSVVSYACLTTPTPTPKQSDRFTYSFTIPSSYSPPPRISPRRTRTRTAPSPIQDDNYRYDSSHSFSSAYRQAVSFEEVFASINGPLFPFDDDERAPRHRRRHRSTSARPLEEIHKEQRECELLSVLFEDIGTLSRRQGKGKQVMTGSRPRRISSDDSSKCAACCLAATRAASPSSSTVSSFSRAGSWLSFRTGSSRSSVASSSSISTAITTPSTSPPISSWLKAPSLPPSLSPPIPFTSEPAPITHSCAHHSLALTSVPLSDTPLHYEEFERKRDGHRISNLRHTIKEQRALDSSGSSAKLLIRRMSKLIDIAKSFQTAYISAAVFSAGVTLDMVSSDPRNSASSTPIHRFSSSQASRRRRTYLNDGCHSHPADVAIFLSVPDHSTLHDRTPPKFIPLVSPFPPVLPPRTALPNPLPFPLYFKPEPIPALTPFRNSAPWRLRHVGNPVCLRLKALKNVLDTRGYIWEGPIREGRMNEGLEKVISVAFDERRVSSLQVGMRASPEKTSYPSYIV